MDKMNRGLVGIKCGVIKYIFAQLNLHQIFHQMLQIAHDTLGGLYLFCFGQK